ncbi:hypothetical protein [Rhodococcus qingshengii]|uniref:hypothetical protein n=1 Tax=Rhodococcus qingshengii TaxID=334542 RepID=UPI000345374D|nr:hypothetical protein [Rhodococcus qingshengii]MBP1053071.1 hypothetical protein [Rhodococcus qingshengii]
MTLSERQQQQGDQKAETREVLLKLIVESAGNINTTNAEHVRALAEAYSLVVHGSKS